MLEKKRIKRKMMDFYYCEEYLTSISNKILLLQSQELPSGSFKKKECSAYSLYTKEHNIK